MRLDKYLADMGMGTRSEIKGFVRKGKITVNGAKVKDPGMHVVDTDTVEMDGRPVIHEEFVYYMMNKPAGVISATEDPRQKTVIDLISEKEPEHRTGLFPAGRLDIDTEGLLLITNDGQTAHRLLSPSHHVDKTYYARVTGCLKQSDADRFAAGISIEEDFVTAPAKLVILRADERESEAEVTIHEGKFHQIKKMFASCGHEVTYLKRLTMGPLVLDSELPTGEYRRLTDREQRSITSL